MSGKLNVKRTILVGFAFFLISAFWQSYDKIVPLILTQRFGMNQTLSGFIMSLDNVFAVFMLPIFGALSDKVSTKHGRRTPFILLGTVCAVVFYVFLSIAPSLWLFILLLLATLIAMATFRSPAVALMPDVTEKPLRSKGNAVINLMGTAGGISVLAVGLVIKTGEAHAENYPIYVGTVCFIMIAALAVFLLTVLVRVDYGFFGILLPVFTNLFRDKKKRLVLFSACLLALCIDLTGTFSIQYFSLFAVLLLALYNGKRGKYRFKYFFYIFYPAHLAFLYGLSMIL